MKTETPLFKLFALLLPGLVLILGPRDPAWVRMWTLAFACYFGCKVLTFSELPNHTPVRRLLIYLFLWPGMDPGTFLSRQRVPRPEAETRLFNAGLRNILLALICLWALPRMLKGEADFWAAWSGMIGVILLNMNPVPLLQFAGLMHLGLIAAGATMPRVAALPKHLRSLPPFIRQLFWVYYSFIAGCLVSFGLLSFFLAPELASGTPLAKAVCGFLTVFWTFRLVAATWILDVRPYLNGLPRKIGYQATNLTFILLPLIYAYALLKGGRI